MKVKKLFFVFGPSCVGKSYLSRCMANVGFSVISFDKVLIDVYEKNNFSFPRKNIFNSKYWFSPDDNVDNSWSCIKSFLNLLRSSINYYFRLHPLSDNLMIEGSSLKHSFVRDIILEKVSTFDYSVCLLMPDFEVWSKQHYARYKNKSVFDWVGKYEKMRFDYTLNESEKLLIISDIDDFLNTFDVYKNK